MSDVDEKVRMQIKQDKKMEKQIPSQNAPLCMQGSWSGTKKTKTI